MGQVIDFPVLPGSYPDLSADLDTAECVLLIAVRWWVCSYRNGDDAIPRLRQGLESAGVPDAAFSIDGLMRVVATTVTRPIDIHGPRCPHLSLDEKHLLRRPVLPRLTNSGWRNGSCERPCFRPRVPNSPSSR
jgi:hypothetical protein